MSQAVFDANDTINGLYGHVYDENGKEQQSTQEFEAGIDYNKTAVKRAGAFMESHRVLGGTGKGTMRILKLDSKLQAKILENPTAKYNYMGKLADPGVNGEEAVLLLGVSFDRAPLMGYKLGELVEVELAFTFDDARYVDTME
jgi:hypothetical protein